jgi:hypothetical protein
VIAANITALSHPWRRSVSNRSLSCTPHHRIHNIGTPATIAAAAATTTMTMTTTTTTTTEQQQQF